MILPAIISWLLPSLLAIAVGWWQGRTLIERPGQFFRRVGIGTLWCLLGTFAIHMVWLAAVMEATGGIDSLPAWAFYWTLLTAMFWMPALVIALVIRARKVRKREGRA